MCHDIFHSKFFLYLFLFGIQSLLQGIIFVYISAESEQSLKTRDKLLIEGK